MRRWFQTYWPYLTASLVVWLPLLRPGYILTLDMVFTPTLRLRETLTNDYGFYLLLHVLDAVLPSDLIQKVLLLSIIPIAGIGLHRLVAKLYDEFGKIQASARGWSIYAGGLLYAINPYTYDRSMAGQYLVLLGYALLPWFACALLGFLRSPGRGAALRLAGALLLISIVSLHTLGLAAVVALCMVGVFERSRWGDVLRYGLLALIVFVVGSSYWLVPTMLGHGSTAQTIQEFDGAHASAFATEGSNAVYRVVNVLRLQGFWMERHDLFALPQDQLPGWGTVRLLIWALVATGCVVVWRRARRLAILLSVLLVIGILCSIGVGQSWLTAIGYREPHKFVALIALVFAIAIAFGAARLFEVVQPKGEKWRTVAASGVLVVIVLFTPTMYGGFVGQLQASQYPDDWFSLNQRLNRQPGRAIFLPWHQYMSFGFAGRTIANPAPHFFDQPVIVSNNPELEGIKQPQDDPLVAHIAAIASQASRRQDLGARLAPYHIRYIILAKEYDYRLYGYLDSQKDVRLVSETAHLKLYRNLAWESRP